jgi:hypothetical protein
MRVAIGLDVDLTQSLCLDDLRRMMEHTATLGCDFGIVPASLSWGDAQNVSDFLDALARSSATAGDALSPVLEQIRGILVPRRSTLEGGSRVTDVALQPEVHSSPLKQGFGDILKAVRAVDSETRVKRLALASMLAEGRHPSLRLVVKRVVVLNGDATDAKQHALAYAEKQFAGNARQYFDFSSFESAPVVNVSAEFNRFDAVQAAYDANRVVFCPHARLARSLPVTALQGAASILIEIGCFGDKVCCPSVSVLCGPTDPDTGSRRHNSRAIPERYDLQGPELPQASGLGSRARVSFRCERGEPPDARRLHCRGAAERQQRG